RQGASHAAAPHQVVRRRVKGGAMQSYKDFRPTRFDHAGLGAPDRQDWFVAPCAHHRGADTLTEANWAEQLARLESADPEGNDHEVHQFGHWACGWFEIVLVRPGSNCEAVCRDLEKSICDYPVLNDDRYSELRWDQAAQFWAGLSTAERRRLLRAAGCPEQLIRNAARRKSPPRDSEDPHGRVWEYLTEE